MSTLTSKPSSSAGGGAGAATHNRSASAVSVPELTLTTDADALAESAGSGNDGSSTGGGGAGGGADSSMMDSSSGNVSVTGRGRAGSSATSPSVPQMYTPPPASPSSISRLQLSKLTDPAFWSALHDFLESQFQTPSSPSLNASSNAMSIDPPSTPSPANARQSSGASTGAGGAGGTQHGHGRTTSLSSPLLARQPGESEVQRLWEDFFLSQKRHLSASEVARVRDQTGIFGLAGV